jgi:hypothetical protein
MYSLDLSLHSPHTHSICTYSLPSAHTHSTPRTHFHLHACSLCRYLLRGSSSRSSKGKLFVDLEWKEFAPELEDSPVADFKGYASRQASLFKVRIACVHTVDTHQPLFVSLSLVLLALFLKGSLSLTLLTPLSRHSLRLTCIHTVDTQQIALLSLSPLLKGSLSLALVTPLSSPPPNTFCSSSLFSQAILAFSSSYSLRISALASHASHCALCSLSSIRW